MVTYPKHQLTLRNCANRKSAMKYLIPFILLLVTANVQAQIDTEFWFAAPDLTKGKLGEQRRDSTIYLVFSSFDQPSTIFISQPANPSFEFITVELPANSSDFINLGLLLSQIETKPANTVLETGLLIRSTRPITAYYEVRGANNSDIFSLKGKNALGTKFYTPFQNEYNNSQSLGGSPYIPSPRSGFIIIATKNNTTVSITPTADLLDHPANETFTIVLNRGETFYGEALGFLGPEHAGGTKIESDKAIAVTIKDDMIDFDSSNDAGADVLGDQMISYDFLGQDHILIKGSLNGDHDRVVICATEDNTQVDIDGGAQTISLNEGEQHIYSFADEASFVSASAKIAVFHVSGMTDQTAGAIIPSLECTGSNRVGFVRGSTAPFFLNVTIRSGSEDQFELNGDPDLLSAADFSPVPGSNGDYVFTRKDFNTSQVLAGSANSLTNDSEELFHLGTTNGTVGASCNYGYFSAFSFLNIGKNREVCLGDTILLDAGPGKTAYLWNTGDETQSIEVTDPGIYYVEVFSGTDCSATDTIEVSYYLPPVDLGPNDTICSGSSTTLVIEGVFSYEWQDGSMNNFYVASDTGIYWVDVSDFQGCTFRDSIHIEMSDRPETPTVFGDTLYCEGEDLLLNMGNFTDAQYRFILPDGSLNLNQDIQIDNIQLSDTGLYQGYYVVEGCESFPDSVVIGVLENPAVDLGPDISVCEDIPVSLDPGVPAGNYEWQDQSTDPTFTPTVSGTYYVTVSSLMNECTSSDTVEVELRPLPLNPNISGETVYCEGDTLILSADAQDGANFVWTQPDGSQFTSGEALTINNVADDQTGNYSLYVELDACYSDTTSTSIVVNSSPVFQIEADSIVCNGDQVFLVGPADMASYNWSTGEETEFIAGGIGNYSLTVVDQNGCFGFDDANISGQGPIAAFSILPDSIAKPGDIVSFEDESQENGGIIETWSWNFGTDVVSSAQNPTYSYVSPGVYSVQLTVIDENGCSDQISHTVVVNNNLLIPSGFSPNGDGKNDVFEILGLEGVDGATIQIFNRWGSIVYESNDYKPGNFWDGDDVPVGTYFYIFTMPGAEGVAGPVTINK